MTSTNASLPKVSYVKSLDIFLGVCFFIVFASLLEYATVGFLMKRQRQKISSTSSSVMPRSSTVCFRELEDGTLKMMAPLHQNQPYRTPRERKPGLRRQASATPLARRLSTVITNGGTEITGIPLFNLHPHAATVTSTGPATATNTGCYSNSNHRGASRCSLGFFGRDEAVMFALTGPDGRLSAAAANASSSWRSGSCLMVRASQVDLFSRIAFPLFFLVFHLAYWSFHLAYLQFE
uniref:Neur_chan_memb domain-containing protein n=1 Tax=Globodera pallida TaxID=36090 RepID=A0A183C6H2_GLOPA